MAGFLSSIFPTNTGQPSGAPVSAAPMAPVVAATPAAPPVPVLPGSSLDIYTGMWESAKDKDGKAIVVTDPLASPILNFDPAKIAESAGKLNFMSGVSPEQIAKALGGDQTAFSDVINAAVRSAVIGVTTSQGQLMNRVIDTNNQRLTDALPTHIKRTQLDQLPMDNPILEHAAVAPLVQALKTAEFNKNPNASPQEVHQKVLSYLAGLSTAINANSPEVIKAKTAKSNEGTDWDAWSQLSPGQ